MIRLNQVKLPVDHTESDLEKKILKLLHLKPRDLLSYKIVRRSVDARKKPDIFYVYTIDAETPKEPGILSGKRNPNLSRASERPYVFPDPGSEPMDERPVIIGSGPAGLFCAYMLAKHGYRPLILEMGDEAEVRREKTDKFWSGGILDTNSNVQFGEGGAGTFSDGKLNTSVKDRYGRNRRVMEIFVESGAPEKILYEARPHLGTDQLIRIVQNMRSSIIAMGGDVYFRSKMTDMHIKNGAIQSIETQDGRIFYTKTLILAIGHSSRDTFELLHRRGIHMNAKPFAVGVRVIHPQEMINLSQYGTPRHPHLGAADYRLAHTVGTGRGVYSFCMCPGGYVVNASSEKNMTAVNGMSYSARDSEYANSAIVVTVSPEDYRSYADLRLPPELQGVSFQRHLESAAFRNGGGAVPVQRFEDFCALRRSSSLPYHNFHKGAVLPSAVHDIFPEDISISLRQGIEYFDHLIPGYGEGDALMAGVESRTSSPVRILRGENLCAIGHPGLYPCGEGAGYAGGITSAAVDGMKTAEAILLSLQGQA